MGPTDDLQTETEKRLNTLAAYRRIAIDFASAGRDRASLRDCRQRLYNLLRMESPDAELAVVSVLPERESPLFTDEDMAGLLGERAAVHAEPDSRLFHHHREEDRPVQALHTMPKPVVDADVAETPPAAPDKPAGEIAATRKGKAWTPERRAKQMATMAAKRDRRDAEQETAQATAPITKPDADESRGERIVTTIRNRAVIQARTTLEAWIAAGKKYGTGSLIEMDVARNYGLSPSDVARMRDEILTERQRLGA